MKENINTILRVSLNKKVGRNRNFNKLKKCRFCIFLVGGNTSTSFMSSFLTCIAVDHIPNTVFLTDETEAIFLLRQMSGPLLQLAVFSNCTFCELYTPFLESSSSFFLCSFLGSFGFSLAEFLSFAVLNSFLYGLLGVIRALWAFSYAFCYYLMFLLEVEILLQEGLLAEISYLSLSYALTHQFL
jgi:hypothetical protein